MDSKFDKILVKINSFCSKENIKFDETKEIQNGMQVKLSNETETITLNIYLGKKGFSFVCQGKKDSQLKELINSHIAKLSQSTHLHSFNSWIGIDESGKGDFFGPLVIAGVLVTKATSLELIKLGVKDSKTSSDNTNIMIAQNIKKICPHSIVNIGPVKYNELYEKFKNLNKLLAWGHARVLENILEKHNCQNAILDKFGDESRINGALLNLGKKINIIMREKAEVDVAVAAASILARADFVLRLKGLEKQIKISLPKGAGTEVKLAYLRIKKNKGEEELKKVAKIHFKIQSSKIKAQN